MSNHYIFVRPGEKVFILTEEIAGETDYTYVFEVEIPVHPSRDPGGRQDNVNFITPGPHWLDNSESMFVRSALASSIYEDTKVSSGSTRA